MRRGTLLGVGLAATLVLTMVVDSETAEAPTELVRARPARAMTTVSAATPAALAADRATSQDSRDGPDATDAGSGPARGSWPEPDGAALAAWAPPQPPPPSPPRVPERTLSDVAPPPAPPPAFPYQWIGQMQDGLSTVVMLAGPRSALGVVPGDLIDGGWRVERIDDDGVEITWLASGQSIVLKKP